MAEHSFIPLPKHFHPILIAGNEAISGFRIWFTKIVVFMIKCPQILCLLLIKCPPPFPANVGLVGAPSAPGTAVAGAGAAKSQRYISADYIDLR